MNHNRSHVHQILAEFQDSFTAEILSFNDVIVL